MESLFQRPPRFSVYVTVKPTKRNGQSKTYTHRVGTCNDKAAIKDIVRKDKAAVRDTLGGLFEPGTTSGRTYRAFEAKWTEVPIDDLEPQCR